jgi:hypothetical protein
VGWRIYVDYTDDSYRRVGGWPRAVRKRGSGANAAAAFTADTFVTGAFGTDAGIASDGDRSGRVHLRIAGHDYGMRAAGDWQQRRRSRRLRPAKLWRPRFVVIERRIVERHEFVFGDRDAVGDHHRSGRAAGSRFVERADG